MILPRCVSDRGFTRDLTTQKARQTERFSSLIIEPQRRADASSNELLLWTFNIVLTDSYRINTSATVWKTTWLRDLCRLRRKTGPTEGIPTRWRRRKTNKMATHIREWHYAVQRRPNIGFYTHETCCFGSGWTPAHTRYCKFNNFQCFMKGTPFLNNLITSC